MVIYFQNMNLNLITVIPIIATVITFLVHTLLGFGLTTTDVSVTAVQPLEYSSLFQIR